MATAPKPEVAAGVDPKPEKPVVLFKAVVPKAVELAVLFDPKAPNEGEAAVALFELPNPPNALADPKLGFCN